MGKRPSRIVGERMRFVRDRAGLSLRELSDFLEARGVDLNPNALSRIENQQRRIDVDELLAISAVLGVSPLGLLATRYDEAVRVTGDRDVEAGEMWEWLTGKRPLPGQDDDFYRRFSTRPDLEHYVQVSTAAFLVDLWEGLAEGSRATGEEEAVALAEQQLAEANERLEEARRQVEEVVAEEMDIDREQVAADLTIRDIERAHQRSQRFGTPLEEEL